MIKIIINTFKPLLRGISTGLECNVLSQKFSFKNGNKNVILDNVMKQIIIKVIYCIITKSNENIAFIKSINIKVTQLILGSLAKLGLTTISLESLYFHSLSFIKEVTYILMVTQPSSFWPTFLLANCNV